MPPTSMTIRYSEDSNMTHPVLRRKAVHSAGIRGTRWKILQCCCPWLLDRGSKRPRGGPAPTRTSSVPVIRVTRVPAVDSDSDSEIEIQNESQDSSYFDEGRRSRSDSTGSISSATSYGAINTGLDIIEEEAPHKDFEDEKEVLTPKSKSSKDKTKSPLRAFLKYRKKSPPISTPPSIITSCFSVGRTVGDVEDEGTTPSSGYGEGADEGSEAGSVFSVHSDIIISRGRTRGDSTSSSTKGNKSLGGSLGNSKDSALWPETFESSTKAPENLVDTPKGGRPRTLSDGGTPEDSSSVTPKEGRSRTHSGNGTPRRGSLSDTIKEVFTRRGSQSDTQKDATPKRDTPTPKDALASRRGSSNDTLKDATPRRGSSSDTLKDPIPLRDLHANPTKDLDANSGRTPSGSSSRGDTLDATGSPTLKSRSLGRKPPGDLPKKAKSPGGGAFFKNLVKRGSQDESTGGSIEEMGGGGSPERGSGSSLVGGMSVGGSHTLGHVPMSKNVSPMPPEGGGTLGPKSSRGSIASLASSETSQADDDVERLVLLHENKRSGLTPLGSPSESMASVCSTGAEGRYGTVAVRGEIEVGLQYNYKEGQLEVLVMQCRDLAAVDAKRNRSDPYVKVYLLPDKSKSGKRKTKVKKHTLNPVFEEVLKFHSTMSELETRTLWVSVWHSDMFGRNDFLGEIILPFSDQVFDDNTPKWHPLQDRTEPLDDLTYNSPRGDLILALKFVPPDPVGSSRKNRRSRGALHVLIKEAKSLAPIKPNGSADPVCKGLLLPEKGKSSKQKTSVCRKTLNPAWNHTLIFQDVSLQDLTERSLEISVWDHDRLGGSQYLGGARLNLGKGKHNGRHVEWMDAAGMEMRLWEQMLDRPNLWVEGSIMLRPSMDKPIYSSSVTE